MVINGNLEMRNKVQVFGLQRSGTNFLEWSLRNNFDINYQNISSIGNVKGDMWYGKNQSLKHCLPTLEHSDYAIVIWRDYDKWNNSVQRAFPHCNYTKTNWYQYITHSYNFANENYGKVMLVEHKWAVENYETMLKAMGKLFQIELKKDWRQPTNYMNRDGGITMSNSEFRL